MDYRIVLVIVIGLVILGSLALWLGRGMRIRRDKEGFSLETEAAQPEKTREQDISVGKHLKITDADVGDVVGIKGKNSDTPPDVKQSIDVLNRGKVEKSSLGDIVGIKSEGKSGKERK